MSELSEYARQHVKDHKPPGALVAVVQPFSGEGEPPNQPRDEDEDDHDDEEGRRNAGGSEQDDRGHHSRDDIDEHGAPVFGPVDATAGAEHELEQFFQVISPRANSPAGPAPNMSFSIREGFKPREKWLASAGPASRAQFRRRLGLKGISRRYFSA